MPSSRPVNETGWKAGPSILSWFSMQKSTMGPTVWSLRPFTIVTTGVILIPAACRLSMAIFFTSKRFEMWRWGVASLGAPLDFRDALAKAPRLGPGREVGLQGEAQAVGGGLDQAVADLLRIRARGQEVRGERGLAARELHRHLPPRLERDGVVEDLLDLLHAQLVHVAHLVGVHEARVAHHVASVREVDREHRAPPILDHGGAVAVHELVAERLVVAPGE